MFKRSLSHPFTRSAAAILLAATPFACGTADDAPAPVETGQRVDPLLKPWVGSSFEQILRVNATEISVRNRCELTVVLNAPKALTFSAGAESIGWKSGSAQSGSLSVTTDCAGTYPCTVTAISRSLFGDGATAQCSVSADDGTGRLIGTSNDNALDIAAAPIHTVIFNQQMKLAQSGSDIANRCTFREDTSINSAVVTNLRVSANGVERLNIPGPISLSTPPPQIGFGTLVVQNDATATLLKHVTGRSEQLQKGDQVLCKGAYEAPSGLRVFDANISTPPSGNGMKMDTASSQWTCNASQFGSGDGCDCSCGIADPDCAAGECQASQCDLNGTFAVLTTTDVQWDAVLYSGITVISAGATTLYSWSIRHQTVNGSTIDVTTKLCGGTGPDLCSPLFQEAYGQTIPYSVYDGPGIPLVPSTMTVTNASPGQPFAEDPLNPELAFNGLQLLDPGGPWPTNRNDPSITWTDPDGDGQLGTASFMNTGFSTYCNMPYNYLLNPNPGGTRIKTIFLGSRVISYLNGQIDTCDTMSGTAAGPDAGFPKANGHVHGCIRADDTVCSTTDVDALDQQAQTSGQRSVGSTFKMVRVANDITCPTVRAMSFQ